MKLRLLLALSLICIELYVADGQLTNPPSSSSVATACPTFTQTVGRGGRYTQLSQNNGTCVMRVSLGRVRVRAPRQGRRRGRRTVVIVPRIQVKQTTTSVRRRRRRRPRVSFVNKVGGRRRTVRARPGVTVTEECTQFNFSLNGTEAVVETVTGQCEVRVTVERQTTRRRGRTRTRSVAKIEFVDLANMTVPTPEPDPAAIMSSPMVNPDPAPTATVLGPPSGAGSRPTKDTVVGPGSLQSPVSGAGQPPSGTRPVDPPPTVTSSGASAGAAAGQPPSGTPPVDPPAIVIGSGASAGAAAGQPPSGTPPVDPPAIVIGSGPSAGQTSTSTELLKLMNEILGV